MADDLFPTVDSSTYYTPESLKLRRELAKSMLAQGLDISPIRSPWQGLARMANAALGGYDVYSTEQKEKESAAKAGQSYIDILSGKSGQPDQPSLSTQPGAPQAPAPDLGTGPKPPVPTGSIEGIIQNEARRNNLDPNVLRAFSGIESGHNPHQQTGQYKGLFQLSDAEFNKYGGTGDIFDPNLNAAAAARKLRAESDAFKEKAGRDPTANELYMIHQQGAGGAANHYAYPDRPAWLNMYSTAEGRQKGVAWAKQAIWGNIPDDQKRIFRNVENVTSQQFTDMWDRRVRRFGGGAPAQVADASGAVPAAPGMTGVNSPVPGISIDTPPITPAPEGAPGISVGNMPAPGANGPVPSKFVGYNPTVPGGPELSPGNTGSLAFGIPGSIPGNPTGGQGSPAAAPAPTPLPPPQTPATQAPGQISTGSVPSAANQPAPGVRQSAIAASGGGILDAIPLKARQQIAQMIARPETHDAGIALMQKVMSEQLKHVGTPEHYGLNPIHGERIDENGNRVPVLLQTKQSGGAQELKMPPGVTPSAAVEKIDAGTHWLLYDKQGGRVIGSVPKNAEEEARQKAAGHQIGEGQGKVQFNLPQLENNADMMLKTIDKAYNHAELSRSTGILGLLPGIPGYNANFHAVHEQIQGQAFLQAFNSLRGGGAISDAEGSKATGAIFRMKTTQDPEEYRAALSDLRDVIQNGIRVAREQATNPKAATERAAAGGKVRTYNPNTGELE
jgi:transglycosylase-like protein with SLT domain